jgi:HSP20 family protein
MSKNLPAKTSRGLASWFERDPFRALREEMDDVLSRFSGGWEGGPLALERLPSLDLSETDNEIQVKVDLPGIKPDEIDIEVRGDVLRISGEHKEEKEEKGKTFHRIERRVGSFSRSVTLPCAVNEEKVSAESHDGVLTIKLTKSEEARTRKIKVKG